MGEGCAEKQPSGIGHLGPFVDPVTDSISVLAEDGHDVTMPWPESFDELSEVKYDDVFVEVEDPTDNPISARHAPSYDLLARDEKRSNHPRLISNDPLLGPGDETVTSHVRTDSRLRTCWQVEMNARVDSAP